MIELGLLTALAIGGVVGWIIVQSFIAHRHWRRVIASGDEDAMRAALLEALDTWRTMRPPEDAQPADRPGPSGLRRLEKRRPLGRVHEVERCLPTREETGGQRRGRLVRGRLDNPYG